MLESYLISVAMKSTVLLTAGTICLRLLRRRDAAMRHLICLATLMSAAATTLLALWSPQWGLLISVPGGPGPAVAANNVGTGLPGWPMVAAAIWALGAFAMLVRAAGGWIVLSRIRRRSAHFTNGDGAEVRIADVNTPLTCGVMQPLILLPAKARDWDQLRLRAVLLHESAHVASARLPGEVCGTSVAGTIVVESFGLDDGGAPESRTGIGL